MIRSMTGYGKGESLAEGRKFVVEIKSVNHKYCEFSIRLPRFFNPFEERLRKKLSSQIFRGRIDVNVNFFSESAKDSKITYNEVLAVAYRDILSQISAKFGLAPDDSKILELVARFPDVVEMDRELGEVVLEELWTELSATADCAIESFLAMREREGAALYDDILGKGKKIEELIVQVEEMAPLVVEAYREKLKKRMSEVLAGVAIDEARFLNEVAHFADKAAIDEEITRLKSHISQLEQILSSGGAIGRKLDFLAQEMAREVNTIGSKSSGISISRIVIDLKSEVEKIREQVQNIE